MISKEFYPCFALVTECIVRSNTFGQEYTRIPGAPHGAGCRLSETLSHGKVPTEMVQGVDSSWLCYF